MVKHKYHFQHTAYNTLSIEILNVKIQKAYFNYNLYLENVYLTCSELFKMTDLE